MTSNTEKQQDQNVDTTQVAHDQEYGLFAPEHNHVHGDGCSCGHDHDHHHHHDHNHSHEHDAEQEAAENRANRYEYLANAYELSANSQNVTEEVRARLLRCVEIFRSPNPEDVFLIENEEFTGLPSKQLYPDLEYKVFGLKSLSSQERRFLNSILETQKMREESAGLTAEERRKHLPESYQQLIVERFTPEQAEVLSFFPESLLKMLFERPNFEEFYQATLKSASVNNLQNYLYQITGYMYPTTTWAGYKNLTQFNMEKVLKGILNIYNGYLYYCHQNKVDFAADQNKAFLLDRFEHSIVQLTNGHPITFEVIESKYGHLDPQFFSLFRSNPVAR